MDGFTDPRIVLCMSLQSLASNSSVWMSVNKGKKNKDLSACLYLAPASYVGQMEYISKLYSEPNLASKLSNQYKEDLSLLTQLFDNLYKKDEMERINALNEAYAACLKRYK